MATLTERAQSSSSRRRRRTAIEDPQLVRKVRRATGLVKRVIDIIGASAALILLAPIMVLIALALRLRGRAVVAEWRIGRRGKPFRCYKFRTISKWREKQLEDFLQRYPSAAKEYEETGRLHDDPRVSPVGTILRWTWLDELPQLFNVLKGDMSLVGPRPITGYELRHYGDNRRYYLLVRPGITGLWQLKRNLTPGARAEFDRAYLENWTLAHDLSILIRTVPALLDSRTR